MGGRLLAAWPGYQPGAFADGHETVRGDGAAPSAVGGTVNIATGSDQALTATDVQTELQLVTSAQVQNQVRAQLGSAPGVSAAEVGQTNVSG